MKFGSRFENIPSIENMESYTDLTFFKFLFTPRSWTGDKYIERTQIQSFISELIEHDKIISPNLHVDNFVPFYFLIDTSVFNKRDNEGNLKLLEFLEELDDFYEMEIGNADMEKRYTKYMSKLRYYMGKPENLGYAYRWAFLNPNHSLSSEVREMAEREFEVLKKAFHKRFDLNKLDKEQFDNFGKEGDKLAEQYSKKEEEFIAKLTKYSYSEPSLFLFNAYFLAKWFEHYKQQSLMFNAFFVVTQYWTNNKTFTDIYQGNSMKESCLVFQEMMGDFLGLISYDSHWRTTNLRIMDTFNAGDVHEEILTTIGKWATKKIYQNRKYPLPKKKWYADIEWDFLRNLGLRQITFIQEKEIAGPDGKELIVYAKAIIGEGNYLIYPIIDPDYWGDLSLSQKALLAYTLCLYHDITVENAFSFEQQDSPSRLTKNPFMNIPEKLVFEGVKITSKVKKNIQNNSSAKHHSKHKPHQEHWVTFHFRKLQTENEASDNAREKAAKYDIEIPKGFTFVDAHIRGGNEQGDNYPYRVSALDMFSKTVLK